MIRTRNTSPPYNRLTQMPLKMTALIYLRDALLNERYELCADIIAAAKDLGAEDAEIRDILENPRRRI